MSSTRPLLWGDEESFPFDHVAGIDVVTRQLVNVEAPMPCSWHVYAQLVGPPAAVVFTPVIQVFLKLGVGRIVSDYILVPPMLEVTNAVASASNVQWLARTQNLAAQSIMGQVRVAASASPFGLDNWTVRLWVAPEVPWKGLEVAASTPAKLTGDLSEASQQFNQGRRLWR